MQPLLGHPASVDELATMTDRAQQRLDRRRCQGTPGALAQQPDQRRAVTVVGLEPPRAQLRPGGLRLRRRKQPSDPGQRRSTSAAHARCSAPVASIPITGSPATPLPAISRQSSSTPSRNTGNDTGSPIKPRSPVVNQTRFDTFPGSIATTKRSPGTSLSSRPEDISPSR